jgi:hypothetical protein
VSGFWSKLLTFDEIFAGNTKRGAGRAIGRSVVEGDVDEGAMDAEGAAIKGDEPTLAEFVHKKKLTRERVVPIILARLPWLILVITASGFPSLPRSASSNKTRVSHFVTRYRSLPPRK